MSTPLSMPARRPAPSAVRVAYRTWTGKVPRRVVEDDDPCLGSCGTISTASCNRVSLIVTGQECPWCIL